MKKNISIVLLFVVSLSYSQSAWVKKKGDVYTQLSFNDISNYNRVFNTNGGDLYPSREITDRTVHWYTEYGITNKLTGVLLVPFKMLKTGGLVPQNTNPVTIEKGSYSAFGNIGLAGRYKLHSKKYSIATQLQLELPVSSYNNVTGLRTGVDAYTITPSLAIGKGSEKMFFQSHLGVFLRTNDYSNGVRFYVEGGRKFFGHLWVVCFVDIVDSFENGTVEAPIKNIETLVALNDSEYGGFGVKLIEVLTDKFGVTAAAGGAFSAHLEAHRPSFNLGVYYKFKTKKEKVK